jgi:hypothetical protein
MTLKSWLMFSIAAVLMAGCAGNKVEQSSENSTAQPAEGPEALTAPLSPDGRQIAQTVERSGTFISGEHQTQGTVRLITQNNQAVIELGQDFATSELGPDLVVILHRSEDVIGSTTPPAYPINEGDYVVLAPLQQFKGAQSYPIPDTINLADYRSVGIWCRKFNATFGAAALR